MKKNFTQSFACKGFVLIFCLLSASVFYSCSKDEDSPFDYDMEVLYGTWKMTHMQMAEGESPTDITVYPWPSIVESTTATFRSDGTYSGKGEFGNGSGTYKASGNKIQCFISGQLFITYTVISLSANTCELDLTMGSETIRIKCKKQ